MALARAGDCFFLVYFWSFELGPLEALFGCAAVFICIDFNADFSLADGCLPSLVPSAVASPSTLSSSVLQAPSTSYRLVWGMSSGLASPVSAGVALSRVRRSIGFSAKQLEWAIFLWVLELRDNSFLARGSGSLDCSSSAPASPSPASVKNYAITAGPCGSRSGPWRDPGPSSPPRALLPKKSFSPLEYSL